MAVKKLEEISEQAQAIFARAKEAANRQNDDYAMELMCQLLELEPAFLEARLLLSAVQKRKFQNAGMLARKMAGMSATPAALKAQATLKKNPAQALAEATRVLNSDPVNATALTVLADAAMAMDLPETAGFALETLRQAKPNDVKVLKQLGELYTNTGENEKAFRAYEQVLKIKPDDADAFKAMKDATAKGALKKGGWEQEGSYRDKMKDQEEAKALEQESRVVKSEEMLANLIAEAEEKLRKEPTNLAVARQLGRLYAQNNDFEGALHMFHQILERQGSDPALEKEITDTQLRRIEADIAAKEAQLQQAPDNAALKQEVAAAREARDKFILEECEKRVERYPNDLGFRFELGELYFQRENVKGAIQQFQLAIKNPQLRVKVLNYLGQCFLKQKLVDIAIRQFTTASTEIPGMDDTKKEVLYNLGVAYDAKGDKEKASECYQQIYEVDMAYKDVAKRLGLE